MIPARFFHDLTIHSVRQILINLGVNRGISFAWLFRVRRTSMYVCNKISRYEVSKFCSFYWVKGWLMLRRWWCEGWWRVVCEGVMVEGWWFEGDGEWWWFEGDGVRGWWWTGGGLRGGWWEGDDKRGGMCGSDVSRGGGLRVMVWGVVCEGVMVRRVVLWGVVLWEWWCERVILIVWGSDGGRTYLVSSSGWFMQKWEVIHSIQAPATYHKWSSVVLCMWGSNVHGH